MVTRELTPSNSSPPTANPTFRHRFSIFFADGFLFLGGVLLALLLLYSLSSFIYPNTSSPSTFLPFSHHPNKKDEPFMPESCSHLPQNSFYDDPELSYSIGKPIKNWDRKRRDWLRKHPSLATGARDRVVLVTGSQPSPCKDPVGDHFLLRFFKNKVDYCRIHGCDVFYNNALLHPKMRSFWAKLPAVRSAMLAHPEAEWIWWVDSDALITDMEFKLPLEKYEAHNLVVNGWAHLIYEKKSWTGLNAGVFLIRNCQWALNFMEVWAGMGPQSPDYVKWGQIQKSIFKDKMFPESDDQTGLIYLMNEEKEKCADKIYLESEYLFQGYWLEIVGTYDNITKAYEKMEEEVRTLRRRHAEKDEDCYSALREECLEHGERRRVRRPFITHFTGCEPCSGDHNKIYSGEACRDGMIRALNFADNQVLPNYGFVHPDLLDSENVSPLPMD